MWNAIYKKLWIIILLPLIAGGVAWYLTWEKSSQYRSVAIIQASVPDLPDTSKTLKDIPGSNSYYDNLVSAMKSDVVTSMVSYRLLLHDLEKDMAFRPHAIQYSNERKEQIRKRLESRLGSFETLSDADPVDQTIQKVLENTNYQVGQWIMDGKVAVERRPASSDINISVATEDPFLSAFAANSLGLEYIRYENAISSPVSATSADDSVSFFREEAERLRKNLEQATADLNETKARPAGTQDEVSVRRTRSNRVSELEMRIVEEEWEVNNLREQMAKMQVQSVPATGDKTVETVENAKILTIRRKIDQLTKIYADGGSQDKQLDSIITKLKTQVDEEAKRLQASQRSAAPATGYSKDREMIASRIGRHEQTIQSLRNDIKRLNSSSSRSTGNSELKRAQEQQAQATVAYNDALAMLKKQEAKSGISVPVSSGRSERHLILKTKALPSARSESPNALMIIVASFLGTMILCVLVIIIARAKGG